MKVQRTNMGTQTIARAPEGALRPRSELDRDGAGRGNAVRHIRAELPAPLVGEHPTRQLADMVLAPVVPSRLPALQQLLAQVGQQTLDHMQGDTSASAIVPFARIEGLHFARFVLLEQPGEQTMLVFAVDYDAPPGANGHRAARRALFEQLVTHAGAGLTQIFEHCVGFEGQELRRYLQRHRRSAKLCFVGAPGRSVAQIHAEAALRREIESVLSGRSWLDEAPDQTPEQIRLFVSKALREARYPGGIPNFPAQPNLEWKVRLAKGLGIGLAVSAGIATLASGLPGAATGLALGLGAAGLYARFRWLEASDRQFQPVNDAATHEQMNTATSNENFFLQNQLTHMVELKDGPLRWLLIRVVFEVLQLLATNVYNHGDLGGIPSIHFARWVMGPRGKVIFLSNFDSSWQSYLGDFIDKASTGLTAVWSNTKGYPRTKNLLRAGSRDAGRFLAWTRNHQQPTQVWYSAYPGLSVVNINANTELRRGLASPALDPQAALHWLLRTGNVDAAAIARRLADTKQSLADKLKSTTKLSTERLRASEVPASALPLDDIQGIILKGYGHKTEASYLLFAIEQATPPLRRWLSQLQITSAHTGAKDKQQPDPLLNIAFSYQGLRKLGLEQTLCDSFTTAFVEGSHHPHRARTNGDVERDAPERWEWGNEDNPVHIALLVFTHDKPSLQREVTKLLADIERELGCETLRLVATLEATQLPGRKEHFGFRDGIAQPVVKGSGDLDIERNMVAAGEFLLGHRDGYGNLAQIPQSSQGFGFGLNGSYMVLRQLEQDVPAFWNFCTASASATAPDLSVEQLAERAVAVAAKMVGRWPSGAPLVRSPERDPAQVSGHSDEDHFGYFETGADHDGAGARCPFGAHIRRTNPRDWALGESTDESIELSNLHRIMRRGRPYGPPLAQSMHSAALLEAAGRAAYTHSDEHDAEGLEEPRRISERSPAPRGLHFMCFNANLERQFEFIQQQWCKNPKFAGQSRDADPLLGIRPECEKLGVDSPGFTIQDDPRRGLATRVDGIQPFVQVKGSSYLFMPSISSLELLAEHLSVSVPMPERSLGDQTESIPDDEQMHTGRLIDNIRLLLLRRYSHKHTPTLRDAHPKMHGCVKVELIPHAERPAALRHGLFASDDSYRGWARFSSEHHDPQPDHKRDTRGLALKLCDVPGMKLLEGEESSRSHDFIFLSTPSFVARDVAEFDEQINALVQKSWLSWLRSTRVILRLLRAVARHSSPLETAYFSVVPALLGPHIVKYSVVPRAPDRSPIPSHPSPDYLREALERQLAAGPHEFDIFVQRFQNKHATPIEDASVLWREQAAPRELVATLRVVQQQDVNGPEQRKLGEDLAFNPFRCLPEHRPVGGISRARRQVYRAISNFRHSRNRVDASEPPSW